MDRLIKVDQRKVGECDKSLELHKKLVCCVKYVSSSASEKFSATRH